jgi:hypothetical protein
LDGFRSLRKYLSKFALKKSYASSDEAALGKAPYCVASIIWKNLPAVI